MRKNLIKTEEALEAKINEGSEASSILNDHRKNAKKVPRPDEQAEKPLNPEVKSPTLPPNPISETASEDQQSQVDLLSETQ